MPGINPSIFIHQPNVDPEAKPVYQKKRAIDIARNAATVENVGKMLKVDFIREVQYPDWLSNVALVKKGKWEVADVHLLYQSEQDLPEG